MKNRASNIAFLLFGAALGGVCAWLYTARKYERIANEEIASVKDAFKKELQRSAPQKEIDERSIREKALEKPDLEEYAARLGREGYVGIDLSHNEKTETSDSNSGAESSKKIYVIPPEDYGESDGYQQISLTYYQDDVLADELGEPIPDAERLVGEDFASHFGEYEDDAVYIRNEELKTEYEILREYRDFSEEVE